MTPVAALVIALFCPAKMPVAPDAAAIVPLLVTTLKSLTAIPAVPLSLTTAPGSTLTVRLLTPPEFETVSVVAAGDGLAA